MLATISNPAVFVFPTIFLVIMVWGITLGKDF